MSVAINCNQEDPSPDMKEESMNALVISGGADNPSKQILEQQSLLVADDHDARDAVVGE